MGVAAVAIGDGEEAAGAVGEHGAEGEALEVDEAGGLLVEQRLLRGGAGDAVERGEARGVGRAAEVGEEDAQMQAAGGEAAFEDEQAAIGQDSKVAHAVARAAKAKAGRLGAPGELGGGAKAGVEPLKAHE